MQSEAKILSELLDICFIAVAVLRGFFWFFLFRTQNLFCCSLVLETGSDSYSE